MTNVPSPFTQPDAAHAPVKVLVYGSSGTGKTVFSGSFPKPCIVDCENGWKSIRSVHGYTPHVAQVSTKADLLAVYDFLRAGDHDFETVVLDSLTDMNKYMVSDVMARNPQRRRDSKDLPAQLDWTESGRVMEKMIYLFRDLPLNVVFIAGERTFGADGQDVKVLPNVAPSLAETLPHLVDVTLYSLVAPTEDGGRSYLGQTVAGRGRSAKDRSAALPTPYVELDWKHIAEAYGVDESKQEKAKTVKIPKSKPVAEKPESPQVEPVSESEVMGGIEGAEAEGVLV